MSAEIACPLCDWTVAPPQPQYAPAVAAALGVPTDALASIHHHQNLRRLEADIKQHLSSHKLEEWVTALTQARAERDALRAEVAS